MADEAATRASETPERWIGGRYRSIEQLGRGAMGAVFRVEDDATGNEVALKLFRQEHEHKGDRLRFRREFHTLAGLVHPRIVEVFDYGVDGNEPFYTMELLEGRDLRDIAPIDPKTGCQLIRDVASALAFLHSRRLLHRDVAPRNVRCTRDGRAKLLDFGVLATMGIDNEVVGTLPCIAPEMLLGASLDQRADLFGLGALAYWLLTGRHAQRIRSMEELITTGRRPPPPPSSIAPAIPPALDELVLGLLSVEPLARPASAIEVIDRVTAIGGLERAEELETARGYVQSAGLVGRQREMAVIRKRIDRAGQGRGRAVVIRGRTGSGKTRLLDETALEAKLAGATVLRAGRGTQGPYAVIAELVTDLLDQGRQDALTTAKPRSKLIARALPAVAERLGLDAHQAVPGARGDAREERLAVQRALAEWLFDVALKRPLVLLVDNLQRCDEASASVLAAMAHQVRDHRLLIVTALRTDEAIIAGGPIAMLRDQSLRIRARGLQPADIERLVREMFGDTPNLKILATWMREVAGGSPLRVTEVARHLVDQDVIRYVEGMWLVPDRFDDVDLPRGVRRTLDARVDGLNPAAGDVAKVLAVHGTETLLEDAIAMCAERSEEDVFAALDQLVAEDVLIGSGGGYRFRQEGLRDAVLRTIPERERAELELGIAEVLAGRTVAADDELRVGWHFLRGGASERGADLLTRAGRRLFEATSFEDAIAPLEAALNVYEDMPERALARVELRASLLKAGFYCDRETALRHRARITEETRRYAGLDRAERLGRVLPARLAFVVGVLVAALFHWTTRRSRRGPRPITAIELFLETLAYSAGVAAFSYDTDGLRWCQAQLAPLRALRRDAVENIIRFVDNLVRFNVGRFRELYDATDIGLVKVEEARGVVDDATIAVAKGGARFQRALAAVRTSNGPTALREIDELEALDTRLWDMGALQARTLHHMYRGEAERAAAVWARAELEFVRLGSLWQVDAVYHSAGAVSFAFIGDTLGLKRSVAALRRLADEGYGYHQHLGLARGVYERLHENYDESREALEHALALCPEGEGLMRPPLLAALAETLFAEGDLERAARVAQDAIDHGNQPNFAQPMFRIRAETVLALAEAERGDPAAAEERLQRLVAEAEELENPVVLGSIHEAAARVAVVLGDREESAYHVGKVEAWYRQTSNPVLIARHERLARVAGPLVASPGGDTLVTEVAEGSVVGETVHSVLSQCVTPEERAKKALEMILQSCGASRGYLFLVHSGRWRLAAPAHGDEPPSTLREELIQIARDHKNDQLFEKTLGASRITNGETWHPVVVFTRRGDRSAPMAAVAIFGSALRPPPESLLESVARSFYEEGDAITHPSTATMTLHEVLDVARRAK